MTRSAVYGRRWLGFFLTIMLASGTGMAVAQEGTPEEAGSSVGVSGLPVPRFVSLKSNQVNVRRGPTVEHQVAWIFKREGLPVEIVAEYENWRRIRDSDGAEGWVYHSLVSGRRTAMVAPWDPGGMYKLRSQGQADAKLAAQLEAGVLASVAECTGTWCRLTGSGFEGWIEQEKLWGVYPGEKVE